MDVISTDVVIIGAGGAGLRAAIAVAETDPSLSLCLLSKVYPITRWLSKAAPLG
jgi:fumarate reductase flavoprotein subunit